MPRVSRTQAEAKARESLKPEQRLSPEKAELFRMNGGLECFSPRQKHSSVSRHSAPARIPAPDVTALRALAWVVSDQDRATRFLALTGCDADTLRRRAGEPDVLGAVLDFLLEDEAALLAFADDCDLPAQAVALSRAALPGAILG
jgi:hypothetical protein